MRVFHTRIYNSPWWRLAETCRISDAA